MADTIVVSMQQKKQTPGTVVFEATADDAAVTTLYVQKGFKIGGEKVESLKRLTIILAMPA
jgi:hypothetical protein